MILFFLQGGMDNAEWKRQMLFEALGILETKSVLNLPERQLMDSALMMYEQIVSYKNNFRSLEELNHLNLGGITLR